MFRPASLALATAVVVMTASFAGGQVGTGTVATFDGTGANAWSGNVRASDDDLVSLLAEGVKKSATLRSLVERLSRSDVIVYVRPDVTAKSNAGARLTFLSATGGYRYIVVRIPSAQSKVQRTATLGHELQHAVSIADAPSVVDSPTLKREFERIGRLTQASIGDDFSFDSPIAEDVRRRIVRELTGDSDSDKVATNR